MSQSFCGRLLIILAVFGGILGIFFISMRKVLAATMSLTDIPVGKVFSINGMKFAKTSTDGELMAICESNSCSNIAHCTSCSMTEVNKCTQCESGYSLVGGVCEENLMQKWNGCGALVHPTGVAFTQGPTLIDERDGKSYEIRKFTDGKCWMVDNLRYGGGTDGVSDYCLNKNTWRNANSVTNASPTTTNGLNPGDGSRTTLFGDCRNNSSDVSYGYLYNWSAAVQSSSAYYLLSYQPVQPTQGICPTGWHLPALSEFQYLHNAAYSPAKGFWQGDGASWKGVYSGYYDITNGLVNQGINGIYWSSTQANTMSASYMNFANNNAQVVNGNIKNNGYAVRCVKD